MICPGAEDLAAWLDGRLSPAERARVEIHLAGCEECREVTAQIVRATAEAGTDQPEGRYAR